MIVSRIKRNEIRDDIEKRPLSIRQAAECHNYELGENPNRQAEARPTFERSGMIPLAANLSVCLVLHECRGSGIGGAHHFGAAVGGEMFQDEVNTFGEFRGPNGGGNLGGGLRGT